MCNYFHHRDHGAQREKKLRVLCVLRGEQPKMTHCDVVPIYALLVRIGKIW